MKIMNNKIPQNITEPKYDVAISNNSHGVFSFVRGYDVTMHGIPLLANSFPTFPYRP